MVHGPVPDLAFARKIVPGRNCNKGEILACCCLLTLFSWFCFQAAYANANMWCTLAQDFLMWTLVVICVSVRFKSVQWKSACRCTFKILYRIRSTLSAMVPMSGRNWNKRTILACCCLLTLFPWIGFQTVYVGAQMLCTLAQDLPTWALAVICVAPLSISDFLFVFETAYESAVFFKHMVGEIFHSLPCPYPATGCRKALVIVHSPAFGGRGMFVTTGVSTVSCYRRPCGLLIFVLNAF